MRLYVGAWYGFSIIISFVVIFHLIHSLTQSMLSFYWKWFHSFLKPGCQCDTLSSSLLALFRLFSLSVLRLVVRQWQKTNRCEYTHTHTRTVWKDGRWRRWKMEDFMQSIYHLICFVVFLSAFEALVGEKKIARKRCKRRTKIAK